MQLKYRRFREGNTNGKKHPIVNVMIYNANTRIKKISIRNLVEGLRSNSVAKFLNRT